VDFIVYGDPNKYSAMAATVGFPTGIAAKMILDGEIQERGMILPLAQDIYRPILKRLEAEGLVAREHATGVKRPMGQQDEAVRY
jgi:alpha-aminoadipic semialdehyde synthase